MKQIGVYHLRDFANQHLDAAEKLAAVEYLRPELFLSPVSNESRAKSVSYATWLELYTLLQHIMRTNVDTIADTGEGLSKLADALYAQDMDFAEQLEYDTVMDVYENGDSLYRDSGGDQGEAGHGPPGEKPGEAPDPHQPPDDIPTRTFDEGDLVNLPDQSPAAE
ncbi:hypothetical protein ACFQ3B_11870 [Stackebrandtia endophytica]|nr:hypothetical protein [Stackebrandtia endophytica]